MLAGNIITTQLYLRRRSHLHQLDVWTKFACLLILFPIAVFVAGRITLILLSVGLIALVIASKLSPRAFWRQLGIYALGFGLTFVGTALLFESGNFLERFLSGAVFALKLINMVGAGILFAGITDPIDVPLGLLRLGIPHKYGITLMVAYRMLPLLSEKVYTVRLAQRARGAQFRFTIRHFDRVLWTLLALVIPILTSALDASVALADTLIARGYSPERPITIPPRPRETKDLITLLGFLAVSLLSATARA